jgi:NADH dehydrogenase (ubiquinone) 1 alpha subcomplex subunit 9
MLIKALTRKLNQSKNIQLYEVSGVHSTSGIRATIFGGTGFLAKSIGSTLGEIGSDIVYPSKNFWTISDNIKRLRLTGNLGMVYVANNMNFDDARSIHRCVASSNVVINSLGPRRYCTSFDQFKSVNIDIPRTIAKQARRVGAKRMIHISSVGVDPRSPSLDLQTKFYGEQAVLDEFPDATILRLATVIGMNDYFQKIFRKQACLFHNFVPVYTDLGALRQPITDDDVGKVVLNVIKLRESMGQTYEIGGPHVYTTKELFEIMMNILQKPLTFAKINKSLALKLSLIKSWQYFNYDDIIKSDVDLIVQKRDGLKTVEDLLFKPASVIPTLEDLVAPYKELIGTTKDDAFI